MIQRKDGRFRAKISIVERGKQKDKYFYGKSEPEVLQKIADYRGEVERGRPFAVVADEWDTKHRGEVSYKGHEQYSVPYRMATKEFEGRDIVSITAPELDRYIHDIAGMGYAQRTVRNHLNLLKMVFRHAVLAGDLPTSPAADLRAPVRGLKKTRRAVPTDEQMRKIIEAFDLPFGLFAALIFLTGCRPGEVLGLRFVDIDRDNELIHISRAVHFESNTPVLGLPKSDAGIRSIPLLEELAALIPDGKKEHYIIGDEKMITKTALRYRWKKFCEAAGVDITPYQLRHGYATMLYEAGIDEKAAQSYMGHSSIQVTKDIYTHIRDEKAKKDKSRLSKYASEFLKG